MPALDTSIEFLPAEAENYVEVAVEVEYDFRPYEPAVMDVNSPMSGPGCEASAEITEIRRRDGEEVCEALRDAVDDWWKRHGETEAIEGASELERGPRPFWRRGRIPVDPCD